MPRGDRLLEHVLRRIGFGASADGPRALRRPVARAGHRRRCSTTSRPPNNVDDNIGRPDYVAVTTRGQFAPNTVINDARQRELFRMVHSQRPLQEKMALFWHNHFATAYSKINGTFGSVHATKMMAGRPDQVAGNQRGQYQLFRDMATGNFRELLIEVAQGSGDAGVARRPQQHARAAAGELRPRDHGAVHDRASATTSKPTSTPRRASSPAGACACPAIAPTPETSYYEFVYNAGQHDADRQDVHLRDLPGRRPDDSGASPRRRACRTAST